MEKTSEKWALAALTIATALTPAIANLLPGFQALPNRLSTGLPPLEILPAYRLIKELAEATPWPDALDAGEYGRGEQLRPWLERAVGLGLGVFDLVIVDEAHKSRGSDSGLTRLLDQVVLKSPDTRHLAMTATPVELEATQWMQMLERIQIADESSANARGD